MIKKNKARIDFEKQKFMTKSSLDIKHQMPSQADVTDWMYKVHNQARKSRNKIEILKLKAILDDLHQLRGLIQ